MKFEPVSLEAELGPGLKALTATLTRGGNWGSATFTPYEDEGLASIRFGLVLVAELRFVPARNGQQVDRLELELAIGSVTITPTSGAPATWNTTINSGSGAMFAGPLAFSVGDPAGTVAPGAVGLTRFEAGMSNVVAAGGSGGAGAGKAIFAATRLDGAALGALTAQWFYHAGLGTMLPASATPAPLEIHVVEGLTGQTLSLLEDTCMTFPYRLQLWSDDDGHLQQALWFVSGARRVTEYDWSGGGPPTSTSWVWSQVLNSPTPACE